MNETKHYQAICDFSEPATELDLRKALAGDKPVKFHEIKKGRLLPDPSPERLRSWLASKCVEEVN